MNARTTTYVGSLTQHHGSAVADWTTCSCSTCSSIPAGHGRNLFFNVALADGSRLQHIRPTSLKHEEVRELESVVGGDLSTHYINGRVSDGRTIRCPLISQISGNLWMGGCEDGVRLPDDFDTVVSLYPWEKYLLGPNTVRYEVRMHDSSDVPSWNELKGPVDTALRSLQEGKKTLIHCQAGLNRSGLVTALVLATNPKRAEGKTIEQIIAQLRSRRHSLVLCNTAFENYLLKNF